MERATTPPTAAEGADERFLHRIRRGVDMLRFDGGAIDELAADAGAFLQGLAIVGLAGLASASGGGRHLVAILSIALAYTLVALLVACGLHLLATVAFEGRGSFRSFFGAFGHTYLLAWILGVPVIETLFRWPVRIWQVAVVAYVLERAYSVERVRAVAAVAVAVVALVVVTLVFHAVAALVALAAAWVY